MWPEVLGLCIPNEDQVWIHSENISKAGHISTLAISSIAQQPSIFTIFSSRQQDQGIIRLSLPRLAALVSDILVVLLILSFYSRVVRRCASARSPHCSVQLGRLLLLAHLTKSMDWLSVKMESVVALLAKHV